MVGQAQTGGEILGRIVVLVFFQHLGRVKALPLPVLILILEQEGLAVHGIVTACLESNIEKGACINIR